MRPKGARCEIVSIWVPWLQIMRFNGDLRKTPPLFGGMDLSDLTLDRCADCGLPPYFTKQGEINSG